LVANRFVLRPVRDLLSIVETALLKAYIIDNNKTLTNALLRNPDNCCLPSEVEKELKRYNLQTELVSFYQKQNRHEEALELITKMGASESTTNKTESSSSARENILNYLMKLDNTHLQLIFTYVKPMIQYALNDGNKKDTLLDILKLFIGEPLSMSVSSIDTPAIQTIRLDPIQVHEFLNGIDQDFAVAYVEHICLKPELGIKQRDIHNRLVYAYCDRIKCLSKQVRTMMKDQAQSNRYEKNDDVYQGIYCMSIEQYLFVFTVI
jgi:hypothetical protein